MANNQIDLAAIFNTVSKALANNQTQLNAADTYNQDHGDHMVEVFNMISKSVTKKQDADVGDQLKYAGDELLKNANSGSAAMYGENLLNAAQAFQGKEINAQSGLQLAQLLLGAQGNTTEQEGGLLGSLLSGFTAGGSSEGLDAGDLLNAGMAFFQSKQEGDSNVEAALDALVAASTAGQTPHRAESGKLVANTLLQALSSFNK
ncbi:MAG: hypothetical protein JEZ00_02855 [Anaerolineaceae bacterium]|nr:hypothetical protein [Anaerolineaceae bacterium]